MEWILQKAKVEDDLKQLLEAEDKIRSHLLLIGTTLSSRGDYNGRGGRSGGRRGNNNS